MSAFEFMRADSPRRSAGTAVPGIPESADIQVPVVLVSRTPAGVVSGALPAAIGLFPRMAPLDSVPPVAMADAGVDAPALHLPASALRRHPAALEIPAFTPIGIRVRDRRRSAIPSDWDIAPTAIRSAASVLPARAFAAEPGVLPPWRVEPGGPRAAAMGPSATPSFEFEARGLLPPAIWVVSRGIAPVALLRGPLPGTAAGGFRAADSAAWLELCHAAAPALAARELVFPRPGYPQFGFAGFEVLDFDDDDTWFMKPPVEASRIAPVVPGLQWKSDIVRSIASCGEVSAGRLDRTGKQTIADTPFELPMIVGVLLPELDAVSDEEAREQMAEAAQEAWEPLRMFKTASRLFR